jgi:hypothetical protein
MSLAVTLFTIAVGGAVLWLQHLPTVWSDWHPATCLPDGCFCEADRSSLIRQPANTISSLGYCLLAALILAFAAYDRYSADHTAPPLRRSAVLAALFATSVLVIGTGSAFYHASLTFVGQTWDVLGMYLLGTYLLLYNVTRFRRTSPLMIAILYVLMNSALLVLLVAWPLLRRYAFGILIFGVLWMEWAIRRRQRVFANRAHLTVALALLGGGFAIWLLDLTRLVCTTDSWIQGHAIWHGVGAVATFEMFLYLRSEKWMNECQSHPPRPEVPA